MHSWCVRATEGVEALPTVDDKIWLHSLMYMPAQPPARLPARMHCTHARTHACIYRYQLPAQAGVPSARWATEPPAFVPCEMHTALAELVASAEELDGKTR